MRTYAAIGAALLALLGPLSVAREARAQELAPPPPLDPGATGAQQPVNEDGKSTRTELDDAEKKDSGRNFELLYVNGDVGGSYINMTSFNATTFGLQKTDSLGPSFSAGAGIRLLILTLGVRARYNQLSMFNLWQLNVEGAFHFAGSSKLDPYLGVHGGYSFVGTLDSSAVSAAAGAPDPASNVSVHGFNGGLDLGFDYYFGSLFSLGVGATGEILFLKRPPVALPAQFSSLPPAVQAQVQNDPLYKDSGSSAGFGAMVGLRVGLHLGL
jgi:hypothetical protein